MNLCKKSCEKCFYFNRCGGCSFCEASICDSNCKSCGSICVKRGNGVAYIKEFINEKLTLKKNRDIDIPGYIPIIKDRLPRLLEMQEVSLVGIHGGTALKSNGKGVRKIYKENGFRAALNISNDMRGILEFYVRDRTLEGIWESREKLYQEVKDMKLEAVISSNFSVYEDAPRIEHLYNINRSIIIYNELIDFGINAIPDVSWYNINDLDYWIDLINNSKCSIISFSFQVVDVRLKASNLWKNYLTGFRYLAKNLKRNVKVIIVGLNSIIRINQVFLAAEGTNVRSLHILNQAAYIHSQRGVESEGNKRNVLLPKEDLLISNIKYLNSIFNKERSD